LAQNENTAGDSSHRDSNRRLPVSAGYSF